MNSKPLIKLEENGDLVLHYATRSSDKFKWIRWCNWHNELSISCSNSFSNSVMNVVLLEKELEHAFDLLLETDHPVVQQWRSTIPTTLLSIVEHFPGFRFGMLRLATQFVEARQMLEADSVLFWLIAQFYRNHELLNVNEYSEYPGIDLPELLLQKRTEILKRLGFPGNNCEVKFLTKLAIDQYNQDIYQILQELLKFADLNGFNHYSRLTLPQLIILNRCPEMIGAKFTFDQLASYKLTDVTKLADTLCDCLRLANQLDELPQRLSQLRVITNLNRIDVIHEQLTEKMMLKNESLPSVDYGRPPLSASETIKPITNSTDLYLEGKRQNHCVFSYHDMIMDGQYYVYQVLYPQRATLGVDLQSGQPEIDQAYLHSNQELSEKTWQAIEEWFVTHQPISYFDKSREFVLLRQFSDFKSANQFAKQKSAALGVLLHLKRESGVFNVTIKTDKYTQTEEYSSLLPKKKQPINNDLGREIDAFICDFAF